VTDTAAGPSAYRRLTDGERKQSDGGLVDSIAAMRRLLPLGVASFEARLARAMAQAAANGGFHLGGFAARRALGRALMVDVDPGILKRRLDHRFKQGDRVHNIRDKFVGGGDWAPLLRSLDRSSTHREVAEIVEAGLEYRKTRSYAKALDRLESGDPVKRNFVALSTPAKVEAYFRQTADMCRSVEEFGIIPRRDYGWRLASFTHPSVRLPWIEVGEAEIGLAIGANGELYRFASGKHRTAAAKALGLASMPAEIRLVNAHWLARQMAESGLPPARALRYGIDRLKLTR
jgi:hypothetical protein